MDEDLRRRESALEAAPADARAAEAALVVTRLRAGEDVPLDLHWRHAPWPARRLELDRALDVWARRPDGGRVWAGETGGEPVDVPAHAGLWLDPGEGRDGLGDALAGLGAPAARAAGADGLVLRAQGEGRARGPGPELARVAAAAPGLARLVLVGFDLSAPGALEGLRGLPALEELALVHELDASRARSRLTGGVDGLTYEEVSDEPPRQVPPPAALAALPRLAVLELHGCTLAAADAWGRLLPGLAALRRLRLPDLELGAEGLRGLLAALDLEAIGFGFAPAGGLHPLHGAALRGWRRLRRLEARVRNVDATCRAVAGLQLAALCLHGGGAGAGLSALGELPGLRRLELHDPWPPGRAAAALGGLAGLAQLEELALGLPWGPQDLAALGGLPRLRRLALDLGRYLDGARPPERARGTRTSPLAGAALPALRALELHGTVPGAHLRDALAAAPALEALQVASCDVIPAQALAEAARLPGLRALELAVLGHRGLPDGLGARPLEALAPLAARPASAGRLDALAVLGVPGLRRADVVAAFPLGGAPGRLLVGQAPPRHPWGPAG